MSKLIQKIEQLNQRIVDVKQAEMVKELKSFTLPTQNYGLATPNEIFHLGLKNSQNLPVQSSTGYTFSRI